MRCEGLISVRAPNRLDQCVINLSGFQISHYSYLLKCSMFKLLMVTFYFMVCFFSRMGCMVVYSCADCVVCLI